MGINFNCEIQKKSCSIRKKIQRKRRTVNRSMSKTGQGTRVSTKPAVKRKRSKFKLTLKNRKFLKSLGIKLK